MWKVLKSIQKRLKYEIKVCQLILKDTRTPKLAKILLGITVGYALMPFDLIPDFIPVLGHLDDAIILPLLVFFALKLIPKEVVKECRNKANQT